MLQWGAPCGNAASVWLAAWEVLMPANRYVSPPAVAQLIASAPRRAARDGWCRFDRFDWRSGRRHCDRRTRWVAQTVGSEMVRGLPLLSRRWLSRSRRSSSGSALVAEIGWVLMQHITTRPGSTPRERNVGASCESARVDGRQLCEDTHPEGIHSERCCDDEARLEREGGCVGSGSGMRAARQVRRRRPMSGGRSATVAGAAACVARR